MIVYSTIMAKQRGGGVSEWGKEGERTVERRENPCEGAKIYVCLCHPAIELYTTGAEINLPIGSYSTM